MENNKCIDCEAVIDVDNDVFRGLDNGGLLCEECEQSAYESASKVFLVRGGKTSMYLVTNLFAVDEEYLEDAPDLFSRKWVSSDAWRGYYETTIKGYTEVKDLTGWTTGYVDETVARKRGFNQWSQDVIENEIITPFDLAFVFEPTSNVFSTAVGVCVKTGDEDKLKEWLGEEFDLLSRALA